jgi:hypothetical protein
MRVRILALAAAAASSCFAGAVSAMGDPPIYDSRAQTDKPVSWGFNTPEEDGRPGQYYFLKAVDAVQHHNYRFAIDMYQTAASWAYKPAQYNLAVMYMKGDGVPVDKPRAMAWAALAAERGDADYVAARELVYAEITKEEFAHANEIWRDLKKNYADAVALERAKTRWAQVKAGMTGSHVGSVGNLKVGGGGYAGHMADLNTATGKPALDANTFSAFGVLKGGSMDGSTAYSQLRDSDNPYDPKFVRTPEGTATVEPLVPLPEEKANAAPADDHPRNI